MPTHTTAEESKKKSIEAMGEPLGKQFHALWQEVAWLYTKWNEYVELFGTKPSRIELLNRAAPLFFRVVQDSLWEETILHIARLTDPPRTMGKENLTILQLPFLVESVGLRKTLEEKIELAKAATEFCRDWRNRRIAHKDLVLAIEEGITPLQPASREKIKNALGLIAEVVNLVSEHYQDSTTYFEAPMHGGAEALLYVIGDGLTREEERMQRIRNGTYTANDIKTTEL